MLYTIKRTENWEHGSLMPHFTHKNMRFKSKNRGFSIIELAVAISVAATVAVGYLVWAKPTNLNNAEKIATTRERMASIEKALSNFYISESKLPCPADPLVRPDGSRASGSGTYDYAREATTINLTNISCSLDSGMPPVITLGLDEEYGYDGWGQQFSYHISDALCGDDTDESDPTEAASCTAKDFSAGTADLTVENESGANLTTEAAYVLISHGPDGIGGYLTSGVVKGGTDNENSDGDTTFQFTLTNSVNSDIISFRTKSQIGNVALDPIGTVISVGACNENSTNLLALNNTQIDVLDNSQNGINQFKLSTDVQSKNSGSDLMLGLLWGIQILCIDYFGNVADAGTEWDGPSCPGGGSFDTTNNVCLCATGTWDGNCTL